MIKLCFPDDQVRHLPLATEVPHWPEGAPAPRQGDVIYLTSTSAWAVSMVIHELRNGGRSVDIEVWLEHVGAARVVREAQCTRTH